MTHSRHMPYATDGALPTTIALLPWGDIAEDFLDHLGVSFEEFATEFTGSFMFRYVEALKVAGIRTVLVCFAAGIDSPRRFVHVPTGAVMYILPATRFYRALRRNFIKKPRGRTVAQMFGRLNGWRKLGLPAAFVLRETFLYFLTAPWLLASVLRKEGCSAILCQEYEYPRFDVCVVLGKLLRIPVFATFQGGDYQRTRLERVLRPLTVRAAAGLIISAETETRRVRERYAIPSSKLARIFSPANLLPPSLNCRDEVRERLGIPSAARVVVWHGRVEMRKKGLDVLLDAWQRICRTGAHGEHWLLLVGTGQDAEMLERRIAGMQLPRIAWVNEFLHDRTTIQQYLTTADVYAFPSRHEGFPVALIEAMACGLPVVAADASGVPDILEGGERTGGIVVARDDPIALADALTRLLEDQALGHELGMRAASRAAGAFSLEGVGKQLRAFLFDRQLPDRAMPASPFAPSSGSPSLVR